MNEKTEYTKRDLAVNALIIALFLLLGMMAIYIRSVQDKLNVLEQTTNQNTVSQQAQIDGLSLNIETVRNDMQAGFEDQQKQIDEQSEKITSAKAIIHNTNVALSRANKQIEEKESEIQELREELKKH